MCLIANVLAAQDAPGRQPTFDELSRAASAARDSNQTDEAIRLYEQALRLKPKWEEGLWYVGALYYETERHAEARASLRQLVAIAPKYGSAWTLLGLCEFRLAEYREAFMDIERGRLLGMGANAELSHIADYHSGILYTKFAQYGPALETLSALSKSWPPNPSFLLALGNAALRSPLFPEEVPADTRAIVTEAGHAAYLMGSGQKDEAVARMRRLVEQYPKTPNVHYAYGMALLDQDRENALEQFKREIEVSPDHVAARLQLAFEHLNRGEYEAGLPYAVEAVARAPEYALAHYALGQVYLGTNSLESAIRELETVVKLEPSLKEAHFSLARAYAQAGRNEDFARERAVLQELNKTPRTSPQPSIPGLDRGIVGMNDDAQSPEETTAGTPKHP